MRAVIRNWTDADQLSVSNSPPQDGIPSLVNVICSEGAMRFQFGMLPEQARAMAAAILACVEEAESAEVPA